MKAFEGNKITVFGDSIPRGIVLKENKLQTIQSGVVDLVAKKLNLEIQNLSRFGQTLKRLCEKNIFENYLSELSKCNGVEKNIAVIAIGGNDCDFDWQTVAETPTFPHEPHTPLAEFEELLDSTVGSLKQNNIEVILFTIPPIDSKKFFENVISKKADGKKVLEFFNGDISNISRRQESYNLAIIKCAMKNRCTLIDIRTRLLINRSFLSFMCEDGVHPNEEGHKIMSEEILKTVKDVF